MVVYDAKGHSIKHCQWLIISTYARHWFFIKFYTMTVHKVQLLTQNTMSGQFYITRVLYCIKWYCGQNFMFLSASYAILSIVLGAM